MRRKQTHPLAHLFHASMRACERRQVRRKMEEENRKARRAMRREYNDTIRELITFVKKRVGGP